MNRASNKGGSNPSRSRSKKRVEVEELTNDMIKGLQDSRWSARRQGLKDFQKFMKENKQVLLDNESIFGLFMDRLVDEERKVSVAALGLVEQTAEIYKDYWNNSTQQLAKMIENLAIQESSDDDELSDMANDSMEALIRLLDMESMLAAMSDAIQKVSLDGKNFILPFLTEATFKTGKTKPESVWQHSMPALISLIQAETSKSRSCRGREDQLLHKSTVRLAKVMKNIVGEEKMFKEGHRKMNRDCYDRLREMLGAG